MTILAVNIRHNIISVPSVIGATRRAWRINLVKAGKCDFVIGVSNGSVHGYYILLNAHIDSIQPNRVAFKLRNCTPSIKRLVNSSISGVNLSGFTTKYI